MFTQAEFEAAMRVMLRRMRAHRVILAIGAAFVVLGVVFSGGDDFGLAVIGLLLLVYAEVVVLVAPRWRWRKSKQVHGEQRYAFDADRATFATPLSESTVSWEYFQALIEEKRYFFFLTQGRLCNAIPKRALAPGQGDALRALAGRRLPLRSR